MALELTYLGFFKLPAYAGTQQFTFNGAQGPLAVNPQGDLFLRGHTLWPEFHAVSIPGTLDGSVRTTGVGDWLDPVFGAAATMATTQNRPRGICFPQGQSRAYGTLNKWYNTSVSDDFSHYSSDLISDMNGLWATTNIRLRTAGSIAELHPNIQASTGHRLMFLESVAQGTMWTNSGPALYTSILPDAIPAEGTIAETTRMTWYKTDDDAYHYLNGAREWDGTCLINGVGSTANYCVWFGRTAIDIEPPAGTCHVWYGLQTVEYLGGTYTDASSTAKGYHAAKLLSARGYRPTMFVSAWTDILAGNRVITEVDLSTNINVNNSGLIYGHVDYPNEKIYVLEFNCETNNRPFIHVYSYAEGAVDELPVHVSTDRLGHNSPKVGGIRRQVSTNTIPAR